MNIQSIFIVQFILSVIAYSLIAKWYLIPRIAEKPVNQVLMLLILPHVFRHMGLVFLVPGIVAAPLPNVFANPAAYGDLTSALLAIAALFALRGRWRLAVPVVWLFNIVGTVDLMNALRQAEVIPDLGATWYIPTFFVPLLLVSHAMIFTRLIHLFHKSPQELRI